MLLISVFDARTENGAVKLDQSRVRRSGATNTGRSRESPSPELARSCNSLRRTPHQSAHIHRHYLQGLSNPKDRIRQASAGLRYSELTFVNFKMRLKISTKMLWRLLLIVSTTSGNIVTRGNPQTQCQGGRCSPSRPINEDAKSVLKCVREGAFPVPGTTNEFYLCKEVAGDGMILRIFRCPEGIKFDATKEKCTFSRIKYNFTEGYETVNHNPLTRQKRFLDILGTFGELLNTGASFMETPKSPTSGGPGIDLSSLENKLAGIEAKLDDSSLRVLERQAERKISSQITQGLLKEVLIQNRGNFMATRDILHGGITQNNENLSKLRTLITEGSETSTQNFYKIQGDLEKLKDFIDQQITKAKSEIEEGFTSVTNSAYRARIEPIVSKLLTSIKDFKHRQNHVMSLPEKNKMDELKRSGGYIDYLESAMLERTLYDIVHQNLAIPKSPADIFAAFILDLLCDGLQFHARILSSIVSSNMYLAKKALKDRHLEDFNTYMLRVHSSVLRMESNLGFHSGRGLIKEIKDLLNNVGHLHFISSIPFLPQLLTERQYKLEHLERELGEFVHKVTPLSVPGRILKRLQFSTSTVPLPIGPWKRGKKVSYAVQHISKERVSTVGEWSQPYEILDRAHPVVYVPSADNNITRIVYRKFDDGQLPEVVAMITDKEMTSFRDIGRDLINAAARPNQHLAVIETKSLVEDGAEINVRLDQNMAVPFHHAAEHNNVEVLRLLLSKGADINIMSSDNMNALHFAASQGSKDALEYLLQEGADINAQTKQLGWSPLHITVSNDDLEATQILLENNAFINIKDNMGLTPLHVSILGSGETMKILLDTATIDVNAKDIDGLTSLHHAARSSTPIFAKQLLQHYNTDVNALSNSQMSPLHYAAITGNVEISQLLIEHKASLTITDSSGSTPLHYAAFYGNTEVTLLMIKRDESLASIKSSKGHTAFDLANANNNAEVALLLNDGKEVLQDIEVLMPRGFPNISASADRPHSQYFIKATNCAQHTMEEIGEHSEEVCSQVDKISNFVQMVMSMVPIPVRGEREKYF
ncbi:alpha-latrotoxin-Lg1a-like isoform X2 [Macrobrachium nipponense]|uniref:alpha-latrotoxin-Lg1a-like isoform X2 n=1 Tax=Macrobrachium nipponense TaxID=159736 RepID=UPI0030C83D4C